jgi:RHS repeat-associated protein
MTDASGKSYTWDFENRLTQAVVPGTNGGTTTFKYDPFGRRIQKSGPLGTTNYLYDGKNTDAAVLEELDISGNVLARYAQSPDVDEPLAELRSGVTSYYQQDALNSVTSLSGGTGALASTYTYDAFGNLTASSGTRTNPYRFTAREFDPETGIYEYRHRYYDSSVGRFISEDPIGLNGGANFYRYVLNNPVKWTDAMGLSPRDVKRIQAACHKCTKNLLTDPGLRADVNTDLGGEWNDLTSWFTKRLGC